MNAPPEKRSGAPAQRPAREESPTDHQATEPAQDSADLHGIPDQLRRRRVATSHLPMLENGARDPWVDRYFLEHFLDGPKTYGLTPREIYAEARRLQASGWSRTEVQCVLADPRTIPGWAAAA